MTDVLLFKQGREEPTVRLSAKSPRARLQASDDHFCESFALGYRSFQNEYEGHLLTDDTVFGYLRLILDNHILRPRWKAGDVAGWFAALFGLSFQNRDIRWPPNPGKPSGPIQLLITEPLCTSAMSKGYRQALTRFYQQTVTDDVISDMLSSAYRVYLAEHSLRLARCCAAQITGWMAGVYGISSVDLHLQRPQRDRVRRTDGSADQQAHLRPILRVIEGGKHGERRVEACV